MNRNKMNLEDLNKEIEKFQKISNREYLPLYAQGKLDAYLELLPLVKKLSLTDVSTWIKISDQEPPKNIEVLAQCPKGVNYLTSWRTNYAVFSCQRKLDSSWDWKWKLID